LPLTNHEECWTEHGCCSSCSETECFGKSEQEKSGKATELDNSQIIQDSILEVSHSAHGSRWKWKSRSPGKGALILMLIAMFSALLVWNLDSLGSELWALLHLPFILLFMASSLCLNLMGADMVIEVDEEGVKFNHSPWILFRFTDKF
jgi:hypothetical protein